MLDLGWGEMLLIGVVALIVVGPKDLPNLFRQLGQFTGKARGMAREFSRAMEAAADDAGVKDIDRTIRAAANPVKGLTDSVRESLKDAPKNRGEAMAKAGISSNPAAAIGDALSQASKPAPVASAAIDEEAADVADVAQGDAAAAAKAVTQAQAVVPGPVAPPVAAAPAPAIEVAAPVAKPEGTA